MSDLHSNNQCDMLFNTAGESMVENFGETSQQSTVCNRVKKPVTVPLFKSLCLQNYKRPTGLTTHFYTFFKTFKCQMVTAKFASSHMSNKSFIFILSNT